MLLDLRVEGEVATAPRRDHYLLTLLQFADEPSATFLSPPLFLHHVSLSPKTRLALCLPVYTETYVKMQQAE